MQFPQVTPYKKSVVNKEDTKRMLSKVKFSASDMTHVD